jgi:integrase
MPVRRFGNVRKLPSGRYQARWTAADGRERRAPNTFETSDDARAWLSEQETDLRRGRWVDPDKGRLSLEGYAKDWLSERPELRPRTTELYQGLLDRHISPGLGHVELRQIDRAAVRLWRAALLSKGVGPVTVAKCYRLLRTIMNTAVEDGRIVVNPCQIKGAGIEESPERPAATVAEVYAIAEAIQPRYRALVLLGAFSGLRFGELAALRWENVRLEDASVTVRESSVQLNDGTLLVGPPKTKESRRTVHVPEQIVAELERHRDVYGDRGLVFAGLKGAPLRRSNFAKVWKEALDKIGGTRFHFHDLRHTGNTLAAATGASTKELMARMGHASQRAALIYQHANAERDRVIAAALGAVIQQHANSSRHVPGTTMTTQRDSQ